MGYDKVSPTLFNITLSKICLQVKKGGGGITKILIYAEDIMLWTNSAKELQENLNWLNNIGNKFYLRINLEKTVTQKNQQNHRCKLFKHKGKQLKEVDMFSNVGSMVTRNGKIQNERIKKHDSLIIF